MRPLSVRLALTGLLATTSGRGVAAASLRNRETVARDQPHKGAPLYDTTRSQQQQVLLPDSVTSPRPGRAPPADSINSNSNNDARDSDTLPKWLNKYKSGFAAFGDSYSAGIGTTIPPGTEENACRQGNGAYPYLIFSDFLSAQHTHHNPAGDNSHESTLDGNGTENVGSILQWLSCTGSTTLDVLGTSTGAGNNSDSQIDMFNFTSGGVTFATLSIGGNDVGFFDVINACVFRFYAFYSGTCEEALTRSEKLISAALRWRDYSSSSFRALSVSELKDGVLSEEGKGSGEDDDSDKKIDQEAQLLVYRMRLIILEILDKVHWERNPEFRVVMTGYAQFFNAETVQCDEVSLGVWSSRDDMSTTTTTSSVENEDDIKNGRQSGERGDLRKRGGRPSMVHHLEGTEREGKRTRQPRKQYPFLSSSLSYRPKLTRDVRKRMNHLVEGVNLLLDGIVADVNTRFGYTDTDDTNKFQNKTNKGKNKKKVIFINYDHLFEGHRFCEEGVQEPAYNRTETWFFLPGGVDNLPSTNGTTTTEPSLSHEHLNSHLVDLGTCLERITGETKDGRSDWGEKALCYMAFVKAKNSHLVLDPRSESVISKTTTTEKRKTWESLEDSGDSTAGPMNRDSMWYVPTYYGKTFHPRSLAHQAIKDRIYKVWGEEERDD